jgi:integrase
MTIALTAVCDDYLLHLERSKKEASWRTAKHQLGSIVHHLGEGMDASLLTAPSLDMYKALERGRVAPETINGRLGALRSALRWAVRVGTLTTLPCQVDLLRVGRKRRRILSKDEVNQLIRYSRPPFDLMVRLAAYSGLRHQEILHLTREDIDFETGRLWVTAKKGWTPKSYHEREIPMHRSELVPQLDKWITQGAGAEYLFEITGSPRKNVTQPIKKVFVTADLDDPLIKPGLHSLRRFWATSLCRVTDMETLRQMGGWSSLAAVQHYLGSDEAAKRKAIDNL